MSKYIEINEEIINLSLFAVIEKVNLEIVLSGDGLYKIIEFDMIEDLNQEFDYICDVLDVDK